MEDFAAALRSRARLHGMSIVRATSLSTIVCGIGWSSGALAQAELPSAAIAREESDEASTRGLEEIVVTAQRRLESVQDVPISVSVLADGKRLHDFDGAHLASELGQDRSLIARAGSDFERNAVSRDGSKLGHQRDDVGLGDG